MKKIFAIILAVTMCFTFVSCAQEQQTNTEHQFVKVTMKDFGSFIVELYPEEAPITVNNFVKLVSEGFYNGLTIHRLYQGLIIQGGDPDGNGTGGPGYTIKGEFAANGVQNNISHVRGAISMARNSISYDSAGSQFFIMLKDYTGWDGGYAGFGYVIEGMDVVDAVGAVEYNAATGAPLQTITIEKMELLTDYKAD